MATILVAHDNASVRRMLILTLGKQHVLIEAEDGWQALELAEQHQPAVVILDVAMPIINGLDVCRRLRADQNLRHTRIIILSASSRPGDARAAGTDYFLNKPCRPSQIRTAVAYLLRNRAAEPPENNGPTDA